MKVIFLDIDGVLNCWNPNEKWDDRHDRVSMIHDDLVLQLNRIIDATGAYLVLSSTWRKSYGWRSMMRRAGIRRRFLGRTISLDKERFESGTPGSEWMGRGKEIQEWLDRHPRVTKYCILDDDSDMLPHQKHFQTDSFKGGLTEDIASQVIDFLNV